MKKVLLILSIAVFLMLTAAPSIFGQTRIKFARGATSAVATGTLNGYRGQRVFVIRVRAGQIIHAVSIGNHPVSIEITDPNGDPASEGEANCNSDKETPRTIAGDYKITVWECQKVDRWRGTFQLKVHVR